MKIAVGSDERTPLTDVVVDELRAKGIIGGACGRP